MIGRPKKYFTEEERKEKARERARKWYLENQTRVKQYREENKEKIKNTCKKWREKNVEHRKEYDKEHSKTPMGRALNLVNAYNTMDMKRRGCKGDLTAKWIVENIFTKPCAHCGKTGWNVIGCNRLDNSKPHTMDNVEPCCLECNNKLGYKEREKTVYQYTTAGELVKIWKSTMECGRNGFHQGNIVSCCNGKNGWKTYKGYRWSYTPL